MRSLYLPKVGPMGWFRRMSALGRKMQEGLAFLLLLLSYFLVIGPYHYLFLLRRRGGSFSRPMARRGQWYDKERSPWSLNSLRKPF